MDAALISMAEAVHAPVIQYTLEELLLDTVVFPKGFKPAYLTKSDMELWMVHEELPNYSCGEWHSDGLVFEIGIDESIDLSFTPSFALMLDAPACLFQISDSVSRSA